MPALAIVSEVMAVIEAPGPQAPQTYHARLHGLAGLSHVTLEVRQAPGPTA